MGVFSFTTVTALPYFSIPTLNRDTGDYLRYIQKGIELHMPRQGNNKSLHLYAFKKKYSSCPLQPFLSAKQRSPWWEIKTLRSLKIWSNSFFYAQLLTAEVESFIKHISQILDTRYDQSGAVRVAFDYSMIFGLQGRLSKAKELFNKRKLQSKYAASLFPPKIITGVHIQLSTGQD